MIQLSHDFSRFYPNSVNKNTSNTIRIALGLTIAGTFKLGVISKILIVIYIHFEKKSIDVYHKANYFLRLQIKTAYIVTTYVNSCN